jgi:type II secretory pathway predicted ATPase ExeA
MSLYLEHFGLKDAPFRITPHTDFFFDGADRGATLEALLYATLHEEGIVKVVGEVGSGKTMLCRVLIERLPAHVETVYLANPSFSRDEILYAVAEELKIEFARERVTGALNALHDRLIESYGQGRRTVILIDEAHAMPEETLEQVRLLSNLETSRHKLLQIVLFGQPELDEVLALASMRQLKDRITHSFRMRPLSATEVATYLSFRMRAAGYRGPDVFAPAAVARIARAAGGLSRRINILADKALLAAYGESAHAVGTRQARAAVADSEFAPRWRAPRGLAAFGATAAAGVLLGAGSYWLMAPSTVPVSPSGAAAPVIAAAAAPVAPAKAAMTPPPAAIAPPQPLLQREQELRLTSYAAGRNPLLHDRLEATRDKLDAAPDQNHSIELYLTENSDPDRVERFLMRARDLVPLEHVYIVPLESGGRYRIWALYGDFASEAEAKQAAKRLPPKYQQAFPLAPRSFAELRRAL